MKKGKPYPKKLTHIFDEGTGGYLPVIDRADAFKALSRRSSAAAFKKKRMEKVSILKKERRKKPPVPGGIGYGVYYKQAYQWNFSNFSCLDMSVLAPETAGGNSSNYLYLTATNGTAYGVEALISYNGQDEPEFKIFDWAKEESDRWTRSVLLSQLGDNISTININGSDHRYCRILNRTEMISGGIWENKICLFNFPNNNWDLVYAYQYAIDPAEQKDKYQGSWGPLVETFQDNYTGLHAMGFYKALLYNDADSPKLTAQNSTIRTDGDGINMAFLDRNWTFYVD